MAGAMRWGGLRCACNGSFDDERPMTRSSLAELLAAAEPTRSAGLASLIERLDGEGRLRGALRDGRPIDPAGLASGRGPGRHERLASGRVRSPCSWRSRACTRTGTTILPRRPPAVPPPRSSNGRSPDRRWPQLVVDATQPALATAAAWWYGDPSRDLLTIGITGTDGKTTTSYLAVAALEAAGVRTGMLGTAGLRIGGVDEPNPEHATTPDAPILQRALRAMRLAGDVAAVIETTSHGLALERVGSVAYDVAILTNLTHEHLEFHGTWEAYRDAKLSLFERLAVTGLNPLKRWPKAALVNADDPSADRFAAAGRAAGAAVLTYGSNPAADVRATAHRGGRRAASASPSTRQAVGPRCRCACPDGSTSTTPWRSSPWVRRWGWTRRPYARGSPRSVASRAGWSAWTWASRSASSSTTPTARPRSRRSLTSCGPVRRHSEAA